MSNIANRPIGPSKAEQVIKLLSRAKGVTAPELTEATGWQPHSCRAFLTGLRKKGHVIERQARGQSGTAYKIIKPVPVISVDQAPAVAEPATVEELAEVSTAHVEA